MAVIHIPKYKTLILLSLAITLAGLLLLLLGTITGFFAVIAMISALINYTGQPNDNLAISIFLSTSIIPSVACLLLGLLLCATGQIITAFRHISINIWHNRCVLMKLAKEE